MESLNGDIYQAFPSPAEVGQFTVPIPDQKKTLQSITLSPDGSVAFLEVSGDGIGDGSSGRRQYKMLINTATGSVIASLPTGTPSDGGVAITFDPTSSLAFFRYPSSGVYEMVDIKNGQVLWTNTPGADPASAISASGEAPLFDAEGHRLFYLYQAGWSAFDARTGNLVMNRSNDISDACDFNFISLVEANKTVYIKSCGIFTAIGQDAADPTVLPFGDKQPYASAITANPARNELYLLDNSVNNYHSSRIIAFDLNTYAYRWEMGGIPEMPSEYPDLSLNVSPDGSLLLLYDDEYKLRPCPDKRAARPASLAA